MIALDAFVAPNATVIGDVIMFSNSSVSSVNYFLIELTSVQLWYGAVLRGDKNKITIGSFTNIQDKAVLHTTTSLDNGLPADLEISNYVTIGHGACLHSCIVKDRCLIGMNAVVLEGCVIEENSMVAAGAVVLPHTVVPSGQLWAGNPAVYIRDLNHDEMESLQKVCACKCL